MVDTGGGDFSCLEVRMTGTVQSVVGGAYEVALEDGDLVEATLRGRLKREARTGDQVVIGDRVTVALQEGGAYTIEAVEPRRTQIARTRGGGFRPRVLVANADRLLVVVSAVDPPVKPELIDRLLVVAEASGVEGVLVINKIDLVGAQDIATQLAAVYRPLGYSVIEASADSGAGIEALRGVLGDGISAMAGPSGVGKSTLANALEPGLDLRTGSLSRKLARGKHTTVSSRLLPITGGGLLADTPGFSDVGVWGLGREELPQCFPEIREREGECKFRGCTHLHEPGCEVIRGVEEGSISPTRYASYRVLWEEAEPV